MILPHIKNMFYESSITFKCKIIETCRILITNIVRTNLTNIIYIIAY